MNFTLLKQRIIGGGEKEPEGFKEKKKDVFSMKDGLHQCEKAIKAWLEGASKMSQAAGHVAELVAATDTDLAKLSTQISVELGPERSIRVCNEALQSIQLKIKLIERLKKDAHVLEDRRLMRNRLERKVEEAKKKDDADHTQKVQAEFDEALNAYNDLFAEVDGSLDFLQQEANGKGGVGLAKPEMDTFKKSSCDFFANCNEICAAVGENLQPVNLTDEWRTFNDRREAKVNETKAERGAGTFAAMGSATNLNAGGITTPPPGAMTSDRSLGTGSSRNFSAQRPPPPPNPSAATPPPPPPPVPVAQVAQTRARALYDYAPQNSDELPLSYGDEIVVSKQEDDGWWQGKNQSTGQSGLFPSNYVEIIGGSSKPIRAESDDFEEYSA